MRDALFTCKVGVFVWGGGFLEDEVESVRRLQMLVIASSRW